ncbi:MAG: type IV pilus biogenesis/stability protein PilW [Litorilituus sp.]|nr:type IV pilus biogenesis/stability protein PilW [Litorilituus sp.]
MVNHWFNSILVIALSCTLCACVTQNFVNGDTPVVQNQANRNDMAATRISLGLGYLKMGNMPQAKQNLEKAKKFAPEMVQVYTAFAHYYETVGEHKLTTNSYEKALRLKSDDADTLNNYGVYLCRQNEINAAERQLLKAIAVPTYLLVAKSYENLASCFLKVDEFIKAEGYLDKAILHSPSSASMLFQMVRLQYAMGEYQQAEVFEQRFEKVTRRFTPQSLALAYKLYIKLGQKRKAKNYATMLVNMYPQSWEATQYLLNELKVIDADDLAKRFQLTQDKRQDEKPKKRVVKLSPKKQIPEHLITELEAKPSKKTRKVAQESVKNTRRTPKTHIVTGGDTLLNISEQYNVKIKALRRWNKLSKKKKIRVNDKLFIENPALVTKIND